MPLRQLYSGENTDCVAKVDIIAVHGLNPRSKSESDHAWDTWRTPSGKDGRLWLRDDLPEHVRNSRIFLYQYDATAVYGQDRDTFIGKASALLEAIRIKREDAETRPILFLGHSMGGLLIEQALINAHNNSKYTSIKNATSGICFFATPHSGGDWKLVNLGDLTTKLAARLGFKKGEGVMEVLKQGSIFSEIMQEHWRHQLELYDLISFWGAHDGVVPPSSARLGLPGHRENVVKLEADHSTVCKFGTSQDDLDNLELVTANIKDLYKKALAKAATISHQTAPANRKPINSIPWQRDPHFVGREAVLEEMGKSLVTHGCVALGGAGGVGKSQTAIEYCWRFEESHKDFHIFWIYAGSMKRFIAAYAHLARQLVPDHRSMQPDELHDSVKSWLMDNDNWLMVVDNADDYVDLFGPEDQSSDTAIYDLLPRPRPESAMIIYTSRHAEIGRELTDRNCVILDVMSSPDALTLLHRRLGRPVDEDIAIRLLEAIEYLPMSITHSAAYITKTGISIHEYLSMLEGSDEGLLDMLSQTVRDSRKDMDAPRSVVNAWLVTFKLLRERSIVAANIFCFMACLDRHSCPKSLILSATSTHLADEGAELTPQEKSLDIELPRSPGDLHSAFGELEALALIKREANQDSFSMHRYVQAITVRQLSIDRRLLSFSTLAADCILAGFPIDTEFLAPCHEADMDVAQRLAPTAYRVQLLLKKASGSQSKARKTILHKLGALYYALGVSQTAADIFAELAKGYGSDFEPEDLAVWQLSSLFMRGAYDEAQDMIDIAARYDSKIDGVEMPLSEIFAMDYHYSRGEYSQMEPMARAMLAWVSENDLDDHPVRGLFQVHLAAAIGGYGITAQNAEEIDDLLNQVEKQLDSLLETMPDSPSVIYILMSTLSSVYTNLEKYSDAERMYIRTIHAAAQRFGPKHIECLVTRLNKATTQIQHLFRTRNLDREALHVINRDLRDLYDYMTASESSSRKKSQLTCRVACEMARSTWICATFRMQDESQKTDCDITQILCEYQASLEEAAQFGQDALTWSYHTLGPLRRQTVTTAWYLIEILLSGDSKEAAIEVAKRHATLSTQAISEGAVVDPLNTYCLERVRDICIRHEQCHTPYVVLLRSNFIQHRMQGSSVCEMLERIQTRQILLATNQQHPVTSDLIKHLAFCDLCERRIFGIRHKCLTCPDYDVCSRCLDFVGPRIKGCGQDDVSENHHRFVPIHGRGCSYRQGSSWSLTPLTGEVFSPREIHDKPYILDAALVRDPQPTISKRWHMDLAYAKGWESEPDESRRTKSRFKRYYTRGPFDRSAGQPSIRRSRSLRIEKGASLSSTSWDDLLCDTVDDDALWVDFNWLSYGT